MYRTHTCNELRLADAGKTVTLAGWAATIRDKGALLWIDLRDRYGLSDYDAATVTQSKAAADYFLAGLSAFGAQGATSQRAKLLANWVMGELASHLNREDLAIEASPVSAQQLAGLVCRIEDGTLSNKIAREVFASLWQGEGQTADQIISAKGLEQIQDTGLIDGLVAEVIAANPKMVEEFMSGKDKALNAMVGQVMKKSAGKANPQTVTDLLRKALNRPD